MRKKKIFKIIGLSLCASAMLVGVALSLQKQVEKSKDFVAYGLDIADEDTQYLGYGYDITSGKAISDPDALMLARPILDVDNPELVKYEKAFSASQTTYLNYSSKSAHEMAREYGMTLGGGISGRIQMVTVSINTQFNTNTSFSKKYSEEYSYYSIYAKNRTVLFQTDSETLSGYLHKDFIKGALAIATPKDANNFFDTYGTHLVTGYNLGGIFEMTNYYATSSSSYVRQNSASFSTQVQAAFGAYAVGTDFSFSANYGALDNNSYAVNNYKCTTHGGYTFPGLTIDQAFSYYETAFGAGYIYGLWTDSINEGKNLAIVSIPQSSKMIPLFNILPTTAEYDNARSLLIRAYIDRCGLSFREFMDKYPDVNGNSEPSKLDPLDIGYQGLGYETFRTVAAGTGTDIDRSNMLSSYVSADDYEDSSRISVLQNSLISFDFVQSTYFGRKLEWKVKNPSETLVNVVDPRNGVFQIGTISGSSTSNHDVDICLELDDVQIYEVTLSVIGEANKYSGGQGTKTDPYLITRPQDFVSLMSNTNRDDWSGKFFKMTEDIDLKNIEYENINPIGDTYRGFSSTFDGDYHTIKNYKLAPAKRLSSSIITYNDTAYSGADWGIFGKVEGNGEIKNLKVDSETTANIQNCYSDFNDGSKRKANLDSISNFGFLVGNLNGGKITNCSVSNASLKFIADKTMSDNNIKLIRNNLCFGIICANAQADFEINDCEVKNCTIDFTAYNEKDTSASEIGYCYGGIVGSANSTVKGSIISKCSVENLTINTFAEGKYSSSLDTTPHTNIGGIAGYCLNTSLSDCLVRKITSGVQFYSQFKNCQSDAYNTYYRAAGVSGWIKEVSIERCVQYGIDYVSTRILNNDDTATASFINGYHFYHKKDGTNTFINCYSQEVSSERINATPSTDGLTTSSRFNYYSLPEEYGDLDYWTKDNNSLPIIKHSNLDVNSINFDFSKVKKTFFLRKDTSSSTGYMAEEFQIGEVEVTAESSNNEDIVIDSYQVDASDFEAKKKSPNTCKIFVEAFGVKASYQATITYPNAIALETEKDDSINLDYYEGDLLNPSEIIVHPVYQTGVAEDITIANKDDLGTSAADQALLKDKKYFEITNKDTPLVAGINNFEITYFDKDSNKSITTTYTVYAKKKDVASVDAISPFTPGSGDSFTAPVGATELNATNFVGLKLKIALDPVFDIDANVADTDSNNPHSFFIEFDENTLKRNKLLVTYEDPSFGSYEIDAKDVEFIHSKIRYGINVVNICYGGYMLDSVENGSSAIIVTGVYDNAEDFARFEEIITILKTSSDTLNLKQKHDYIVEAVRLKTNLSASFGDENPTDNQKYVELCNDLNAAIASYNEVANSINNSFVASVKVTYSFSFNSFVNSGYFAFPLALAILILLF